MKNLNHHEKIYIGILGSLLVLTFITVWVSYFNFGVLNVLVAMLIATIKASLVALFFMHLYEDNRLNQVVFISSFVFLAIFVGLTASDLLFRSDPTSQKFSKAKVFETHVFPQHVQKYEKPSKDLITLGEELYPIYCERFLPKNYAWPRERKAIFELLTYGDQPQNIPSFSDLGEKERWAVTHYIFSQLEKE